MACEIQMLLLVVSAQSAHGPLFLVLSLFCLALLNIEQMLSKSKQNPCSCPITLKNKELCYCCYSDYNVTYSVGVNSTGVGYFLW